MKLPLLTTVYSLVVLAQGASASLSLVPDAGDEEKHDESLSSLRNAKLKEAMTHREHRALSDLAKKVEALVESHTRDNEDSALTTTTATTTNKNILKDQILQTLSPKERRLLQLPNACFVKPILFELFCRPTPEPSPAPSPAPSEAPTSAPSRAPSVSAAPSVSPSHAPSVSAVPSSPPSEEPSVSAAPSELPSEMPSVSAGPSELPSEMPSVSAGPSEFPSVSITPSSWPSSLPSASVAPSMSMAPSMMPSIQKRGWFFAPPNTACDSVCGDGAPGNIESCANVPMDQVTTQLRMTFVASQVGSTCTGGFSQAPAATTGRPLITVGDICRYSAAGAGACADPPTSATSRRICCCSNTNSFPNDDCPVSQKGWILGPAGVSCTTVCDNNLGIESCADGPLNQVTNQTRMDFVAAELGVTCNGYDPQTGTRMARPLITGSGRCDFTSAGAGSTCGATPAVNAQRFCCCSDSGTPSDDCPVSS